MCIRDRPGREEVCAAGVASARGAACGVSGRRGGCGVSKGCSGCGVPAGRRGTPARGAAAPEHATNRPSGRGAWRRRREPSAA
eukprot:3144528-Prymnesium_polylepis.1